MGCVGGDRNYAFWRVDVWARSGHQQPTIPEMGDNEVDVVALQGADAAQIAFYARYNSGNCG